MQTVLRVPNSSSFFSILFLPRASETGRGRYNDVEDTLARANAWFNAAQASGIPIALTNIQTESLLTKVHCYSNMQFNMLNYSQLLGYVMWYS